MSWFGLSGKRLVWPNSETLWAAWETSVTGLPASAVALAMIASTPLAWSSTTFSLSETLLAGAFGVGETGGRIPKPAYSGLSAAGMTPRGLRLAAAAAACLAFWVISSGVGP